MKRSRIISVFILLETCKLIKKHGRETVGEHTSYMLYVRIDMPECRVVPQNRTCTKYYCLYFYCFFKYIGFECQCSNTLHRPIASLRSTAVICSRAIFEKLSPRGPIWNVYSELKMCNNPLLFSLVDLSEFYSSLQRSFTMSKVYFEL